MGFPKAGEGILVQYRGSAGLDDCELLYPAISAELTFEYHFAMMPERLRVGGQCQAI
jgi:hypothetical protein